MGLVGRLRWEHAATAWFFTHGMWLPFALASARRWRRAIPRTFSTSHLFPEHERLAGPG